MKREYTILFTMPSGGALVEDPETDSIHVVLPGDNVQSAPAVTAEPVLLYPVTIEVWDGKRLVRIDGVTEHSDHEYWRDIPDIHTITMGPTPIHAVYRGRDK